MQWERIINLRKKKAKIKLIFNLSVTQKATISLNLIFISGVFCLATASPSLRELPVIIVVEELYTPFGWVP